MRVESLVQHAEMPQLDVRRLHNARTDIPKYGRFFNVLFDDCSDGHEIHHL